MNAVHHIPARETSSLGAARVRRQLTVEAAAARAGITPDQVEWLEEGRVYRFASADDALVALLLYATALGIDHAEARELAGLPGLPGRRRNPHARAIGAAAIATLLTALVFAVLVPGLGGNEVTRTVTTSVDPSLPAPWQVTVDVRNGSGDIDYTRRVASRIQALGYQIAKVRRADRFDYTETAVYYPPRAGALAERLGRQLDAPARPLPGGNDPRRLVVIVGPQRGPG